MPRTPQEIFARRLSNACDANPAAPPSHGRQAWLRRQLEQEGDYVSATAVNNWFNAYTRASPALIHKLSRILGVTEAWLIGLEGADSVPAHSGEPGRGQAETRQETFDFQVPLRVNLVVQLRGIPLDLTAAEARKISSVVTALAQPQD